MKLVEFNGLPGSGKSTVSKQLLEQINSIDNGLLFTEQTSKTRLQKLFNLLRFSPVEIWHLYRICRLQYKKIDKQLFSRIIYSEQIFGKYRRLRKNKGICIVDQGIVQTILSIFYIFEVSRWDKLDPHIISLLNRYKNDVIFVNSGVDISTSLERLRSRKTGKGKRYDNISDDKELYNALERQQATLQHVRGLLAAMKNANVIDIDMHDTVDENCNILMSEIKRLV